MIRQLNVYANITLKDKILCVEKIKILFYNLDAAGVNYFRTQTPAIQLEMDHSDKFQIEVNSKVDFRNMDEAMKYLKQFHIIHYHRTLIGNLPAMKQIVDELKKNGTTLIIDIDDYWFLDKTHPFYRVSIDQNLPYSIIENLKMADYVTTTTDHFAKQIKNELGIDAMVLPNSVNPEFMTQFVNKHKPDPDGLVRFAYMAGSSHKNDMKQVDGITNPLSFDPTTKNKFKIILAGWDTRGDTTDVKFNEDFGKEMMNLNLWNKKMIQMVNASKGNIDMLPIPNELKNKYRDKLFFKNKRPIEDHESVYFQYEKMLTDNYKMIPDQEYVEFLKKIKNEPYPNEFNFGRRWTQKANIYARVLNETDVSIAPLGDNMFNRMKSNLKQVECWSRKLAIICSDVIPYNVDGKHMKNCILIPNKKNAGKYWTKAFKKLITEPNLREDLGEQLYEDFHIKYHLRTVTNNRANFYQRVVEKEYSV